MMLAGCTTNGVYDAKKTWTLVGVLAVGAYAASQSDSGSSGPNCRMISGPIDPVTGVSIAQQYCD